MSDASYGYTRGGPNGPAHVVTVETPASSYLLADREIFKAELQVTGSGADAYIDALIEQASAFVERYCKRVFALETLIEEFWPERDPYPWQVPGGVFTLQLDRWPIVAVASVTEALHTLDQTHDYRVDARKGQLTRLDPRGHYTTSWPPVHISVTYTAGYAKIPADLADAVTRIARARWFARRRDPNLRSETIPGVYEGTYWFGGGPGSSDGLPPDITAILDFYRVPTIA